MLFKPVQDFTYPTWCKVIETHLEQWRGLREPPRKFLTLHVFTRKLSLALDRKWNRIPRRNFSRHDKLSKTTNFRIIYFFHQLQLSRIWVSSDLSLCEKTCLGLVWRLSKFHLHRSYNHQNNWKCVQGVGGVPSTNPPWKSYVPHFAKKTGVACIFRI